MTDELHADGHHRAATLFEAASRLGAPHEGRGWRHWLDELFLRPRWDFIGIVVPYMIPLLLLLVALEEAGVMARIAFAVDRTFHRIGLHGIALRARSAGDPPAIVSTRPEYGGAQTG